MPSSRAFDKQIRSSCLTWAAPDAAASLVRAPRRGERTSRADKYGRNMPDQSNRIEIVSYDPGWPCAFAAESARLWSALEGLAVRIEHHGSTAVPGLSAKPIIDIQVSVACLQPIAAYGERLRALGYVHVPHTDDAVCPFFHRPHSWPHTHHVHVVERDGHEEWRTLAFRNYLRDHPDVARQYADLKRALATRFAGHDSESREAYAHAKTDFVQRVTALALDARSRRPSDDT